MQTTPITPHVRSRQDQQHDVDELAEHMGSVHIAHQPSKRSLQHGATPASQARPRTLRRTAGDPDGKENAQPQSANTAIKYTPSRLACFAELKDELSCSICLDICVRPCTTPCGHTFCRSCLRQALRHSLKCPKCRGGLPAGTELKVNTSLWNTIQLLFPAHAAEAPPVTPAEPQQARGPRRAAAARGGSRQLPVLLLPTVHAPRQAGAHAAVPGQAFRAPAFRAPRQAGPRAPAPADPDIDLSDDPEPSFFGEFVVSPLSPPIAPHFHRAAAAPTRRTRGQALVALLHEGEGGVAGQRELMDALELQQMWDDGRQGRQGVQGAGARSSQGATTSQPAAAAAAVAAARRINPFRRSPVRTQPLLRRLQRQQQSQRQQQPLELGSDSEWDSDLELEVDEGSQQRAQGIQPGGSQRQAAGRAPVTAAQVAAPPAAAMENPFRRTGPRASALTGTGDQAVDEMWHSLGMLDTPPRAPAPQDRGNDSDSGGLFGRLHSGHTPPAATWQQQAAAGPAGGVPVVAGSAAEAYADGNEIEDGAEQLPVLMNPWRASSAQAGERLEAALTAAAAALAAQQPGSPGSPASIASEDAQQLVLPLSPEPLLARIRQDSGAVGSTHSSNGFASSNGSASSAGADALPHNLGHNQPTAGQAAASFTSLHMQMPSSLQLPRPQRVTNSGGSLPVVSDAAFGAGVQDDLAAVEDGEADDFQPSQRSRRSAAAVRAAARAAGSGGAAAGAERGRRQRFVSGLRRGAVPSRQGA